MANKTTKQMSQPRIGTNPTLFVYKVLREKIIQRQMSPGSKINQEELAKELGVSRTPIVKALHKLESEGLVDNIAFTGFFVHQLTIMELMELYTLREALDIMIINNIIEKATPEQIRRLEDILPPDSEDWSPGKIEEYRVTDVAFHSLLLDMCTNPLVRKIDDAFQVYNRSYQGGMLRHPIESLQEHRMIIKAIKEKNSEEARILVAEHPAKTRRVLENIVDKLTQLGLDPAKLPVKSLRDGSLSSNVEVFDSK